MATNAASLSATAPARADPLGDLAGLEPVETIRRRWPAMLGGLLSLALVIGLARELLRDGLAGLDRAAPDSPWFYVVFALLYLASPMGDLFIYRYLWRIPWLGGLIALNNKRMANDVVLGYSGEAYFYAWARTHVPMVAAPFGAVKDVSILSGIAGNTATILLCAVALPLGYQLIPPHYLRLILASAAVMLTISGLLLAFSGRVFSLPRRDLVAIVSIHAARIVVSALLLALAWHLAMPEVSLLMWLFLSAGRLLVSRLPLLPNKDLLFASFAMLIIGEERALSEMIAFTAALQLLVHVLFVAGAGVSGARGRVMRWRRG